MKRILKILAAAFALAVPMAAAPTAVAESVYVSGGTDAVIFDDDGDFELFTEFADQPMFVLQNKLYAPVLAESKAIYKYGRYSDVEVSVDITPINKSGNIDGGIYVQASDASNAFDGITAWNVNVEHAVGSKVFALKLHRFENRSWKGAKVEIFDLPYAHDTVNLRVIVKAGVLHAYADGRDVFSHYIGTESGKVGIRNFYAPVYYENFKVTAPTIAVEPELLDGKLEEFENFDFSPYTEETAEALRAALAAGRAALAKGDSQTDMDKAYADILSAHGALALKKTRDDLSELIEKANKIIADRDSYTQNSTRSLEIVLSQIASAEDEEIPYLYKKLKHRIESAVRYDLKQGENDEQ